MSEFQEEIEIFNRRVGNDTRLKDFLAAPLYVVNNSGTFALQVGNITIQETSRVRADDFSRLIDTLCAINDAEMEYLDKLSEEVDDDYEPDLPDFGPPGSGAVVTEYQVGTYDEPW